MPHYNVTITADLRIKARDEEHARIIAHERIVGEFLDSGDLTELFNFEATEEGNHELSRTSST